jgi:hypothetical protein
MSRNRGLLVHLLIVVIIAGSAYDIATRQEHWPFSDYPMFAVIPRQAVLENSYRLFGVTYDNREVAILKYSQLWPLDQSRLPIGLRRLYAQPGGRERVRTIVEDALRRYERGRAQGRHNGPALRGMRLYSLNWDLEPYAANLDRPRSRELLVEVGPIQEAAR